MRNIELYKTPDEEEEEFVLDELVDTDDEENNIEVPFIIPNDNAEDSDAGMEPEEDDAADEDFELSEDDSDFTDSSDNSSATNDATAGSSVKRNTNITGATEHASDANSDIEEEDDPTVRSMIAEIKKKRTTPPEIIIDDFITDICFHPQRDIIALATITGDVHIYQYGNEGNKLLRTIEVHAKACRDVEFTNDGLNLLTCSKDKSILITDVETEKLKKFYESAHEDAINKLYVMDENLFTTGDDNGVVKMWDLRTKHAVFELKEVEDYITQMLTNDDMKLLLVTSGDGYLTTINIGARKLYVQSEPYDEELNCMGTFRNDSKLVVGTSKGRMYTFNWGEFGYHCDMFPGMKMPMSQMVPITDRIACVAGEDGIIRACHIMPHRNLGIVGQHNMHIEALDVNWNGELIASSSHNNDVRFWNVRYFEDFGDPKPCEKPNPEKERRHNLPSSKYSNATDFFADLANEPEDD